MNFDERPFVAIWETTQACDLACVHCRACAQPARNPLELSTDEAKRLIDEIAAMEVPVFVLTGGDPLKRPDIFELVRYATEHKVRISLTPSATPLLTRENIVQLKECGLARLAVSLDGPTAEIHDAFRRVKGSYEWTINAVSGRARSVCRCRSTPRSPATTWRMLDDTIALLEKLDIVLWSVFFLVPTGRGQSIDLISAEEFEQVFEKLYETSQRVMFDIKSTEAQHYRRFLLQRRTEAAPSAQHAVIRFSAFRSRRKCRSEWKPPTASAGASGINDGKGFVFISHLGEVFPSGFLPVSGGNVRKQSLADIYRNSPLFRSLRDSKNLEGKCGRCEFREICGGLTGEKLRADRRIYSPRSRAVCTSRRNEPSARQQLQ